jgi:phosphate transport system substrate-binding protein
MMMTLLLILPVMIRCSNEGSKSVTTDGSTSMQKVIGGLGEAFQSETGMKCKLNKGAQIIKFKR